MDEEATMDRSETTEEIEDKSEMDLDYFDKSENETTINDQESTLFCSNCNIKYCTIEELNEHNLYHHPIFIYKCTVENCLRWFISKKNRDKHAENTKMYLHRTLNVKPPPAYAVVLEDATQELLDKIHETCHIRKKKPVKKEIEREYLGGMPKDQLKRKLMESVSEKIDYLPVKRSTNFMDTDQDSQQSSTTKTSVQAKELTKAQEIPVNLNVPPNPPHLSNNTENIANTVATSVPISITDTIVQVKTPFIEYSTGLSYDDCVKKLIGLLDSLDCGNYFTFPFIEEYAPNSNKMVNNQVYMSKIKDNLNRNIYSLSSSQLKQDLLSLYSKGLSVFPKNSIQWKLSNKLYQTVLNNYSKFKEWNLSPAPISTSTNNNNDNKRTGECFLPLLNPYSTGRVNSKEKIATIGDQIGKSKNVNSSLLNLYQDEKTDRVILISYLDYGPNFSFGPSYDSGSSFCTKSTSDDIISSFNDATVDCDNNYDNNATSSINYQKLEKIIPESYLGDDFSLYLMNALTYDVLESFTETQKHANNVSDDNTNSNDYDNADINSNNNNLQKLLDDNYECLNQLKYHNYQRLAGKQILPSTNEIICAEKTINNLTSLISVAQPGDLYTNQIANNYPVV